MVFDSFFSKKDKRICEENKPFVDRKEYIQDFKDTIENIKKKERKVFIYHGVAGIGKTSLRKEFPKIIEEHNESNKTSRILWVTVNFETEEFRQPQKFLEIMRNQFQDNYEIKFHTFDIAHALYWSKVNPRVQLSRENYSDNSIITHLLDIGDNLASAYTGFSPAKLISDIGKLVKKFPEQYTEWEFKNIDEISRLTNMEPSDIEKRLYLYWAYDLHEHLQKTSEAVVIFIDSYEALWGKDRSLSKLSSEDQRIKKLIQKLLSYPCLWILCGQEFPRWEEFSEKEKIFWENLIEIHKIKDLPEEDACYLLEFYDIHEKDIQDTIISGSKGVPYYLDLSIDTYKNIKKIKKPEPSDFAKVPEEVFERFIKYLDENKEAAIKVLSVPNFWNREIFNFLIKEFTNYPLNSFAIIHSFSFIDKDEIEEGKWNMHQLMRQSWQEYQEKNEPDERKSVHEFMFNYYENKLKNLDIKKITQEHKIALIEAYYHAKEIMDAQDFLNWFIEISKPFDEAAYWQLIAPMYEELLLILEVKLGLEHEKVANALNNLAGLYYHMGDFDKARTLYHRALEIIENFLDPQHPYIATTLSNLGGLYSQMGEYEKALLFFQRTLDIIENVKDLQYPCILVTYSNLAFLYSQMGVYGKALPLSQIALDISEKALGPQHPDVAKITNNLALIYHHMGAYEKALSFYQRSLDIREKVLGLHHPSVAIALNNLAGLYYDIGDYEKALPLFRMALEIQENVLGSKHPDVATTLNYLAVLYDTIGDHEKALSLYQRSLDIYEIVLGPKHPSFAAALNNLAVFYRELGDDDNALLNYQRSLEIYENVLGSQHPSVATTLNNLGELYRESGDYDKALPLFQRSLDIREKVLGPNHQDVAVSLNSLALLYRHKGVYNKALQLYQRSLDIYENSLGLQHPDVAQILNNLAELYNLLGNSEKALTLLEQSLEILERKFGPDYPYFTIIENRIFTILMSNEWNPR